MVMSNNSGTRELAHKQGFDWKSWYTDENFPKEAVT